MARRKKASVVLEHAAVRSDSSSEHEDEGEAEGGAQDFVLPTTPRREHVHDQPTPTTSPRKRARKAHVSVSEINADDGASSVDEHVNIAYDSTYDACDEADVDATPRPRRKTTKEGNTESPKKGTGKGKSTSEHAAEYSNREEEILAAFFVLDYDPAAGSPCACERISPGSTTARTLRTWRCTECFNTLVCCECCIVETHRSNPFHRIQHWNGRFFERATLRDAGFVFHLGHDGEACPHAPDGATATKLTICDLQGFQEVDARFCVCPAPATELSQLLACRLFPATFTKPRTAFTWTLMEDLRLDTVQSKKPIYDYFTKLVRISRNVDVNADKKGYENISRAARFYNAAMRVRQSGQGQGIDKVLLTLYPGLLYPGSVMLPCPSCPHAGFNTPDNLEELVGDPRQEHKYRANLGMDGSYKQYLKKKRMDKNDVSLCDGRGIFVRQSEISEFRANFSQYKDASGSCPSVDRMHQRTRVKGSVVSGVFMVICLRHSVAPGQGAIDIIVGERFAEIDLALMRAQGPEPWKHMKTLLSFDKNCQYWINFEERIGREFGKDSKEYQLALGTSFCVPKFHIANHIEDCQYQFHPGHVTGAGRISGEEVEPPWVEFGQAGAISRDMNPGHRHELIEDVVRDWNFKKIVATARSLMKRAKEVATHLQRTKEFFSRLSDNLDSGRVARWLKEYPSEKAEVLPNKDIKSRFKSDVTKHPARQTVVDLLREETRLLGRGRGAVHMLHKGIKLELRKAKLLQRLKDGATSTSVLNERSILRREIAGWRRLRNKYIPVDDEVEGEADEPGDEDDLGWLEKDDLLLPSAYGANARGDLGIEELAAKELKLHTGEAEDAVTELCLAIRTFRNDIQFKRAEVSGQTASTRAQAALDVTSALRNDAAFKYRFHYDKMLALGLDPDDERYRPLEDSDVVAFNSTRAPQKVGSGKAAESWIWRGNKDVSYIDEKKRKKLNDLGDDDLRVFYFRSLAQYLRWGEDGEILLEDFKRAVKSFENYRDVWNQLAEQAVYRSDELEREAEAAKARMEAYMMSLSSGTHSGPAPETPAALKRKVRVASGQGAYAAKKAAFFESMRGKCAAAQADAIALIGNMVEEFGRHAGELVKAQQDALLGDDEDVVDERPRRRRKTRA